MKFIGSNIELDSEMRIEVGPSAPPMMPIEAVISLVIKSLNIILPPIT